MWLIYKTNSTKNISSPENATLNDECRQMCTAQSYASGPFTRRDAWGAVAGVWGVGCVCAWNGASVYN